MVGCGIVYFIFFIMDKENRNYAFIDGQNLYMGTAKRDVNPWKIDLFRFRKYLFKKYNVVKVYYFLGYELECYQKIYRRLKRAGFDIIFREYDSKMIALKKGNVDSDIIFYIMKKVYTKEDFDKVILVSGDGDYKLLVDFLIVEKRFERILFPYKRVASSLYKKLGTEFFDYLEDKNVRDKIELKVKRAP